MDNMHFMFYCLFNKSFTSHIAAIHCDVYQYNFITFCDMYQYISIILCDIYHYICIIVHDTASFEQGCTDLAIFINIQRYLLIFFSFLGRSLSDGYRYYKTKKSVSLRYFNTCFMHNIGIVSDKR